MADPSDPQGVATHKNHADMAPTHKTTISSSPITNVVAVVKADSMTFENCNFTPTSAPNSVAYMAIRRPASNTGNDPSQHFTPFAINECWPNGSNRPAYLTDILQLHRSGVSTEA